MTDNDIIKALGCCSQNSGCTSKCPLYPYAISEHRSSGLYCFKAFLDLINRQEAEIERLKEEVYIKDRAISYAKEICRDLRQRLAKSKTEAVKEFAESLKKSSRKMQSSDFGGEFWDKAVLVEDIDNLVKEMVGAD